MIKHMAITFNVFQLNFIYKLHIKLQHCGKKKQNIKNSNFEDKSIEFYRDLILLRSGLPLERLSHLLGSAPGSLDEGTALGEDDFLHGEQRILQRTELDFGS